MSSSMKNDLSEVSHKLCVDTTTNQGGSNFG
jgi:hypothetical protein